MPPGIMWENAFGCSPGLLGSVGRGKHAGFSLGFFFAVGNPPRRRYNPLRRAAFSPILPAALALEPVFVLLAVGNRLVPSLFGGDAFGIFQVGTAQVCIPQLGKAQYCTAQVSFAQVIASCKSA